MARMIPPVLDKTVTKSPGERKLFQLLAEADGTQGWVVLHSQRIARPRDKERGEADFVVLIPEHGVLVLEVKASRRIVRRDGRWYYGTDPKPGKDPFQQVEVAMHALMDTVAMAFVGTGRHVLFADAVVFTDVDHLPSVHEWKPRQVIDARSVTAADIAGSLVRSLGSAAKELKQVHGMGRWTFDPADVEAVTSVLRPGFDVTLSPAARRRHLDDDLLRFTREQLGALDSTALNRRIVFEGPAGTGKTLLAIESVIRALDRDERVLFVCHNRALASHLQEVLASRMTGGALVVGTLHRVLMDLVGLDAPPGDQRAFFERELPEAALSRLLDDRPAVASEGFLFDTVVVDELQDLASEPYLLLLPEFLRRPEARLVAFGDLENQAIFQHADAASLRARAYSDLGNPAAYQLLVNCRNTPRVVSWVTGLVDVTPGYSGTRRPDDGRDPKLLFHPEADQPRELARTLDGLLKEGYAAEEIIVLSVGGQENSLATRVEEPTLSKRLVPYGRSRPGAVAYSSVFRFKGLERRVVVLTDIDAIGAGAREALYVGLTRATDRVVLITSPCLVPEIMERIQVRHRKGAA